MLSLLKNHSYAALPPSPPPTHTTPAPPFREQGGWNWVSEDYGLTFKAHKGPGGHSMGYTAVSMRVNMCARIY
jgi:hypothetical protein